jgi:UDPglucose 6-dehydrogenase
LLTEWEQFRVPSWKVIKKEIKGNIVIDGRNIYDGNELNAEEFILKRIGRA